MTATFTLTGTLLDRSKAPIVGAAIRLTASPASVRDDVADEVYSKTPQVTTNEAGELIVVGAESPGVSLVAVGQYTIQPQYGAAFERVTFDAPESGTIDLADLIPAPAHLPATWATTVLAFAAQVDALEAQNRAALARDPLLLVVGTITRNESRAATDAAIVWPDGTPGQYVADILSETFPGAVDAYHVTYGSPPIHTFTQPAVTRNDAGDIVDYPAIVTT